ncbi:MAG: heavy metal translocating P-type ATPase [Gemmatimonadales bacterium]|nr:heavy metal translocating P-type ATPase [Gemmatimonadales bacterium]
MSVTGWALAALAVSGAPLVLRTLRQVAQGNWATDVVATLSILTALALREPWPGLVVVLMQAGGEALERWAAGRASRAVEELEAAAPREARRLRDGRLETIPVAAIAVGDRLLVRPGDFVPVDGIVASGRSHVDTSRLTGEPLPVSAGPGTALPSGAVNQDGALELEATAIAGESRYARIVQLVRSAQASKAPLQRLADRMAGWFTPLTVAVAAGAWAASGDARRALAVLVVATPCPMILAAPVAFVGGISRAARRRIIVRSGGAMERVAGVTAAVLDKTGTLTEGQPTVAEVTAVPPFDRDALLRLAGGVEQGSTHVLARALAAEAARAGPLPVPAAVTESAGRGVVGVVDGREVLVGSLGLAEERAPRAAALLAPVLRAGGPGAVACVVVDGAAAGVVRFADRLRPQAREVVDALRGLGLAPIVLLSGDQAAHVHAVGATIGVDEARGDLHPEDKVTGVRALERDGRRVLMVGDGTNDAPALAAASAGVALAAHGGGITAEAADIVILADDLGRVPEAVTLARETMRVARQSLWLGLGASSAAMAVAALGYIAPTGGAVLQEVIDVLAITNALRAARGT